MGDATDGPDGLSESVATSLVHRSSCVNHAELPILAAVASSKIGQVLVWDGRFLHMYSGSEQLKQAALPHTVSPRSLVLAVPRCEYSPANLTRAAALIGAEEWCCSFAYPLQPKRQQLHRGVHLKSSMLCIP